MFTKFNKLTKKVLNWVIKKEIGFFSFSSTDNFKTFWFLDSYKIVSDLYNIRLLYKNNMFKHVYLYLTNLEYELLKCDKIKFKYYYKSKSICFSSFFLIQNILLLFHCYIHEEVESFKYDLVQVICDKLNRTTYNGMQNWVNVDFSNDKDEISKNIIFNHHEWSTKYTFKFILHLTHYDFYFESVPSFWEKWNELIISRDDLDNYLLIFDLSMDEKHFYFNYEKYYSGVCDTSMFDIVNVHKVFLSYHKEFFFDMFDEEERLYFMLIKNLYRKLIGDSKEDLEVKILKVVFKVSPSSRIDCMTVIKFYNILYDTKIPTVNFVFSEGFKLLIKELSKILEIPIKYEKKADMYYFKGFYFCKYHYIPITKC